MRMVLVMETPRSPTLFIIILVNMYSCSTFQTLFGEDTPSHSRLHTTVNNNNDNNNNINSPSTFFIISSEKLLSKEQFSRTVFWRLIFCMPCRLSRYIILYVALFSIVVMFNFRSSMDVALTQRRWSHAFRAFFSNLHCFFLHTVGYLLALYVQYELIHINTLPLSISLSFVHLLSNHLKNHILILVLYWAQHAHIFCL